MTIITPPVAPTTAANICVTIQGLCRDALVACGSAPLSRVMVAAGLVAWDDCCGTLAVAPERIYRSAAFPAEGPSPLNCLEGLLVIDVLVLLLRCIPVVNNRGLPPTVAATDEAYRGLLTDSAIIWNTLANQLPREWDRANLNQAFVGAEGGCIGSETRVTIGLLHEQWGVCP